MNTSMTLDARPNASKLLKVTSAVGIIWYAFGLLQFWVGYSMDTSAAVASVEITAAHGAAIDATPFWVWLSFAIASAAGLVGSMFLFSRSSNAKFAFTVSLISAGIYYGWMYGLSGTGASRPPEEAIIAAVVVCVTALYFWLSRRFT